MPHADADLLMTAPPKQRLKALLEPEFRLSRGNGFEAASGLFPRAKCGVRQIPLHVKTWSGLPSKCKFCARFCNLFREHKLCCNLRKPSPNPAGPTPLGVCAFAPVRNAIH